MKNCNDIQQQLDQFVDAALDAANRHEVDRHLAECADCRWQLELALFVESRLRGIPLQEKVPAELWARIEDSLVVNTRKKSGLEAIGTFFFALFAKSFHTYGAALALVTMVVVSVAVSTFHWGSRIETPKLADEIVNEFRVFAVSRRPLDITSSNRLSVQQWFANKVNFQLPTPPLNAPDVRFVGGRLCNILGKPVASYMYSSKKMYLSLYVMDKKSIQVVDEARDVQKLRPGVTLRTLSGITYVSWTNKSLHFSLVAKLPFSRMEPFLRPILATTVENHALLTRPIEPAIRHGFILKELRLLRTSRG